VALAGLGTILRSYFVFLGKIVGLQLRKSLVGLIHDKVTKFSMKAVAQAQSSKMVTMISGELQMFDRVLVLIPYLIISPLSLIFGYGAIGILIGHEAVYGFIFCVALVYFQKYLT
jgi:hypothetical protein